MNSYRERMLEYINDNTIDMLMKIKQNTNWDVCDKLINHINSNKKEDECMNKAPHICVVDWDVIRETERMIKDMKSMCSKKDKCPNRYKIKECSRYKHQGINLVHKNNAPSDTSDGYHTFDELYEHRTIMFSVICNQNQDISWKSKKHYEGDMFDGMFIVGITTPKGNATYHCDLNYWDLFDCKVLANAPEWDGHTPNDVIFRLQSLK